jgi:hypothetical protein
VAEQVKVAHSIENLVFDELVAVTQAILVEDTEFVENDGVFQAATESQPFSRRYSTSCMKPKVRARETSRT